MNTSDRRTFLQASAGVMGLSAAAYAGVLGANERVGIGFIGYGLIAKTHVQTFSKLPEAALLAVADVHAGRREEGRAKLNNPDAVAYADFRKLLADRRIDAVVISTPDHWHALMTMLACAAGKDVYVEKPLTLFVREGEWMAAVADRTRRIVQVGTQQRSGSHYVAARRMLREGQIGRIHSVRMSSHRNIFPGFGSPPDAMPPSELDYDAWLGPAPQRAYNPNRVLYHFRWFWDYSGGQMTNLGAHHLDIVDWIVGLGDLRAVSSVGGRFALQDNGETPDTQDVLFQFENWSATMSIREASSGSRPLYGVEFFGTKGSLGIDRRGWQLIADPRRPPENSVPGVKEGHPVGGPKAVPEPMPPNPVMPVTDNSGSSPQQYRNHAQNFLACIKDRSTPVSDLASAQRTAIACHLANLSLRLGRSLRWDATAKDVLGDREASAALIRPYRKPWDAELRALGVSGT